MIVRFEVCVCLARLVGAVTCGKLHKVLVMLAAPLGIAGAKGHVPAPHRRIAAELGSAWKDELYEPACMLLSNRAPHGTSN